MEEEREYLKKYVDTAVKKVEGLISEYTKETKEENDSIKETIENIKNYLNVTYYITHRPNLPLWTPKSNKKTTNALII